jgi:hypothetical protein
MSIDSSTSSQYFRKSFVRSGASGSLVVNYTISFVMGELGYTTPDSAYHGVYDTLADSVYDGTFTTTMQTTAGAYVPPATSLTIASSNSISSSGYTEFVIASPVAIPVSSPDSDIFSSASFAVPMTFGVLTIVGTAAVFVYYRYGFSGWKPWKGTKYDNSQQSNGRNVDSVSLDTNSLTSAILTPNSEEGVIGNKNTYVSFHEAAVASKGYEAPKLPPSSPSSTVRNPIVTSSTSN